jgi:hypothetical protein
LILAYIFLKRYRVKYSRTKRSTDFLFGVWLNQWGIAGHGGSEVCNITTNGEYFVGNVHAFNIENLKIDASTGSICFDKVSVNRVPERRLHTELKFTNNSKIEGTEFVDGEEIKISYTRIQ